MVHVRHRQEKKSKVKKGRKKFFDFAVTRLVFTGDGSERKTLGFGQGNGLTGSGSVLCKEDWLPSLFTAGFKNETEVYT